MFRTEKSYILVSHLNTNTPRVSDTQINQYKEITIKPPPETPDLKHFIKNVIYKHI